MLQTILQILVLLSGPLAARDEAALSFREEKRPSGTAIVAVNSDRYGPRWVELGFPLLKNMRPDRPWPVRSVVGPGEQKELALLRVEDPHQGRSYRYTTLQGFGDPSAAHDPSARYLFPWEHGAKHSVDQGYFGSSTHLSLRALDFNLKVGDLVCAARDGVVVAVRDSLDGGGLGAAWADKANFIDVLHPDGTWATYAHLRKGGALVRPGARVKAGDPLGYSGAVGQVSGPHLHFAVLKAVFGGQPETLATRFRLDGSRDTEALEGKHYYAWHPGKPDFHREEAAAVDEGALRARTRTAKAGGVSLREEKLDDKIFLYASNGTPDRQELRLDFGARDGAEPSQPLPLVRVLPPRTELFLLSVTMKPGGSYRLQYRYRKAP
jgi:murein DD-endopeptidase MepM/ murein hydrolase activator NlpD